MRIVTYGAACSLDGFIARSDGAVDWLRYTQDAQAIMADYWPRIDTILMGRKTWEVAARAGSSGGGSSGIRTFVFSRTLTSLPSRGATLVREDPGEFVRELKRAPGKDVCVMSGGDFAASLLAAGVVDEIGLNVHPVLLGAGIPMFLDPRRQVDLELAECRPIAGGCVWLSYRVARAAPAPAKSKARRRSKKQGAC
jgi:dihydrofolate reductase